jgi:hypothetical protein
MLWSIFNKEECAGLPAAKDSVPFHDRSVVCAAALLDYLGTPGPRAL